MIPATAGPLGRTLNNFRPGRNHSRRIYGRWNLLMTSAGQLVAATSVARACSERGRGRTSLAQLRQQPETQRSSKALPGLAVSYLAAHASSQLGGGNSVSEQKIRTRSGNHVHKIAAPAASELGNRRLPMFDLHSGCIYQVFIKCPLCKKNGCYHSCKTSAGSDTTTTPNGIKHRFSCQVRFISCLATLEADTFRTVGGPDATGYSGLRLQHDVLSISASYVAILVTVLNFVQCSIIKPRQFYRL